MGTFQLQCYRVLSHPAERLMAITDRHTVRMLGRIARGKHDCCLCRAALDLDANSESSPGLIGYWHGNFSEDVDAVCVAACVACVRTLGNEEAAKSIGEIFADEVLHGGTVELVHGGTA